MEPVATRLLGEPNHKLSNYPTDVRYGTHGSLSVNMETGEWYDHEAKVGGGVLDLIVREIGGNHADAMSWLCREGLIADTRPKPQSHSQLLKPPGSVEAIYDYNDENGELLFQVVRSRPKDFRQRRPDGKGGWRWKLDDVRRVPYRLPELIAALKEGHTIYVTEGEKDADNVCSLGFAATTCAGGANKWFDDYSQFLSGADVVLLPHNDEPGRRHAEQVSASLNGIAKRIRILDIGKVWAGCRDKGDISDWIGADGTADNLKTLVEALPDWRPTLESAWKDGSFTAEELRTMTFPPISWILPNIIPAEGLTLLCSKPKFGKSWLVYDLCIACTMDRFTLGTIRPAQGDVLYLALEDSRRRLQRRMAKLLPERGAKWPEKLSLKTEWRRLHEGGLDDIRAWYADTKANGGKPILVVIDVLAKVRKAVGNRQLYEADYGALADLTKLANELGLAIVVVHHSRKMAADDLMETVSGSFGISGAADTILVMATKGSGAVLDVRGRDVESAELAIEFDKGTCRWRSLGNAADVRISEQRRKIITSLEEAVQPMTIKALVDATKMQRNPLEVLLGRMVGDGEILRVATGLYAHKGYTPPPNDTPTSKGKPTASVASVSARKDRQTDVSTVQPTGTATENVGICPSVASVRESADDDLIHAPVVGAAASGPTQTDWTDRQMQAQPTDQLANIRREPSVSDLSGRPGQTDGGSDEDASDRCDYCGNGGLLNEWDWQGGPIKLHPHCEERWHDREMGCGQ